MTEYIDKTEAMRRFKPFGREIPKDIVIGVIASVKEDIVRCKDCMHKAENYCYKHSHEVTDGDFCSYGERSEE